MCGIVGFTGRENATPVLLDGLKRLEYRGYDSAGVVVYSENELKVIKKKGEVSELCKAVEESGGLCGHVGTEACRADTAQAGHRSVKFVSLTKLTKN